MKQLALLTILILLLSLSGNADVVVLRDGTRLDGWVESRPDALQLTIKSDQNTRSIPVRDVIRVELAEDAIPPTSVSGDVDQDARKLLDEFAALPDYPEAGAIYLEDGAEWVLQPDGSYTMTTYFTAKILQDRRKRLAFASFSYDKQRESIRVDKARTITPDGRVIPLDPTQITDRESFQGSEFYSRYKTLSFTLPDVTVGCIVDWQVTQVVHKPLFDGYFTPRCYFGNNEPTHRTWMRVSVPREQTLHFSFRPCGGETIHPEISDTAGRRNYYWSMMNIPAMIEEDERPPFSEIIPHVVCSLFADWTPVFDWNGSKIASHIAESSPDIVETAKKITESARDEDGRIALIYYWIQQNIRYVSVKGDVVAGLAGHPARETFEKKYGDCVDKAILMSAMLRSLGTECHPTGAMTNSGGDWITDIPHYFVNHSFVYIRKQDSTEVWLDPTTTNFRYPYFRDDDHGIRAMIPTLKTFKDTPIPLIPEKLSVSEMNLTADGNLEVFSRIDLAGGTEASYRGYLKNRKPEERQDALARMLNGAYPGVKVQDTFKFPEVDELQTPFFLESRYTIENYAKRAGDLLILNMPGTERSFSEVALEERRYPIEYHTLNWLEKTSEVTLPPGWKVDYLPESLLLDTDVFRVHARYEKTSGGFRYLESYQRLRHHIPVKEYAAFKEQVLKLQDFGRRRIVLRRTGGEQ